MNIIKRHEDSKLRIEWLGYSNDSLKHNLQLSLIAKHLDLSPEVDPAQEAAPLHHQRKNNQFKPQKKHQPQVVQENGAPQQFAAPPNPQSGNRCTNNDLNMTKITLGLKC